MGRYLCRTSFYSQNHRHVHFLYRFSFPSTFFSLVSSVFIALLFRFFSCKTLYFHSQSSSLFWSINVNIRSYCGHSKEGLFQRRRKEKRGKGGREREEGIEVVGGGHTMNEMNRGRRGCTVREKSRRTTDNERRYKLKVKRSDRRG